MGLKIGLDCDRYGEGVYPLKSVWIAIELILKKGLRNRFRVRCF
jgi:hypothetical protein